MADYSTLYPTLTRKSSPGTGAGGSASTGSGIPGLDGLNDAWDPNGNFVGGTSVTGDFSGGGGGGFNYGKLATGLAPLALSLFAPKDTANVPGAIGNATAAATQLGASGAATTAEGNAALAPVLNYLAAVTSGDPSALLAATMSERRRVIDQYDTARQAAQFSPRGGGTSSAVVNANTREAGDLASIGANARAEGIKTAAQLGTTLTGQGQNAQSASVSHLTQLLGPLMANKQNDQQSIFSTFSSIASLIGLFA